MKSVCKHSTYVTFTIDWLESITIFSSFPWHINLCVIWTLSLSLPLPLYDCNYFQLKNTITVLIELIDWLSIDWIFAAKSSNFLMHNLLLSNVLCVLRVAVLHKFQNASNFYIRRRKNFQSIFHLNIQTNTEETVECIFLAEKERVVTFSFSYLRNHIAHKMYPKLCIIQTLSQVRLFTTCFPNITMVSIKNENYFFVGYKRRKFHENNNFIIIINCNRLAL